MASHRSKCGIAKTDTICLLQRTSSSPSGCEDHHTLLMLTSLFASNSSLWAIEMSGHNACQPGLADNMSIDWTYHPHHPSRYGKDFYAFVTPFIIVIGNSVSVKTSFSLPQIFPKITQTHTL